MSESMQYIKSEFLLRLQRDQWDNPHAKRSFWATDCLKPAIDLFWRWNDEPPSNPIEPEKLLMFRAADAFEYYIIQTMVRIGEAVDLEDRAKTDSLGVKVVERNASLPQVRMEMEREYVPVSGYLDGITPKVDPIEVKTYYSPRIDLELSKGKPPNEQYLYQLATYMDFLGTTRGILVMANRSTGNVFFIELMRQSTETLVFTMGDRSMGELKEIDKDNPEESPEVSDMDALGNTYRFDLGEEYKRWRRIMEENIVPRIEPALEYQYRPAITKELIDLYLFKPDGSREDSKIRLAIKGRRVLSEDKWRYQYSPYKDKIIEKEMKQKGFKTVDELCTYKPDEIRLMMELAGLEFQKTKDGRWKCDAAGNRKLFKKKLMRNLKNQ